MKTAKLPQKSVRKPAKMPTASADKLIASSKDKPFDSAQGKQAEFLCPYFAEVIAPELGMRPEDFTENSSKDPCSFCRCTH